MNADGNVPMAVLNGWRVEGGNPYVQRDTASLIFGDGRCLEFHVRGAIAWPRIVSSGEVAGAVVVAGLSCTDGRISILSEALFATVGSHFNPDEGRFESLGLDQFLRVSRLGLFCSVYFWRGEETMARLMAHEVYDKEESIGFHPRFVEVAWPDGEYARSKVTMAVRERTLVDRPFCESLVEAKQVAAGGVVAGTAMSPRVDALCSLLTGFSKFKWRGAGEDYF